MAKELNKTNENVANAVAGLETFLNEKKKLIWGIVIAAVVVAAGAYLYYDKAYLPAKEEGMQQMYKAEAAFRDGNYDIALNGDGNNLGFKDIIEEYGNKAGNDVYFYAAVCEMNAGNAEAALEYIGKYNGKDEILAGRAKALEGDAYCALENYSKAAACYMNAAKISDNDFSATYLLKAGITYEALQQNDKALEVYKQIKDQYSQSLEAYDIDKYITRIEVK